MKISRLALGMVAGFFLGVAPVDVLAQGCEYRLELLDSFGDGWNGGSLTVRVVGVDVLNGITLASGVFGVHTFSAENGDVVRIMYTSGSWAYENEYRLYGPDGELIHASGVDNTVPLDFEFVASCRPPVPIPYCQDFATWPPNGWELEQLELAPANWSQNNGAAFHNYFFGQSDNWLVSPPLQLPSEATGLRLEFDEKISYPTWYEYSGVLISTGSPDPEDGDFVELHESNRGNTDWERRVLDLSAYTGQVVFVAFNYRGNNAHAWWVDNVCVTSDNLALNKPLTPHTNTQLGLPNNANDGDSATVWYSYQGGGFNSISFTIDLGQLFTIGRYVFKPLQTHSWMIETSEDGVTWFMRHSGVTDYWTNPSIDNVFTGGYQARYIRYTGNTEWNAYSGIAEFEVYSQGLVDVTPITQGTRSLHDPADWLPPGWTYAASSSDPSVVTAMMTEDERLEIFGMGLGTATITVIATNPIGGEVQTHVFSVVIVGSPLITHRQFAEREAWNPRFEERITVQNTTGFEADGVRLLFSDLQPGIEIENQTGVAPDGRPMIEWRSPLPDGTSETLRVVYIATGALRPDEHPPTITAQFILPTEPRDPNVGGEPIVAHIVPLDEGRIAIQFNSTVGRTYFVEYSDTSPAGPWLTIPTPLTAAANKTQWIDHGPPTTLPFGNMRFYRIRERAE